MGTRSHSSGSRGARLAIGVLGAMALVGCVDRPVSLVQPRTQSGITEEVSNHAIDKVDLLLEVDNSGSMEQDQLIIAAQLQPLIATLTNPPDADHDGNPDYPPVHDLHVGVISQDLGAPGSGWCGGGNGDDGLLNPIANGQQEQMHVPTLGRDGCMAGSMYPTFLAFDSTSSDPTAFGRDFQCSAVLGRAGCGLEQQLEAVYRALRVHHATDAAGSGDPNAGFLREDALLAVVLLTDEEDGSVRDCRYAEAGDTNCNDARSVWNQGSPGWGTWDPNMRLYMYQPGSAQDPTWPLDRYVDPNDLSRGLMGLKPGHPERIVFAAITGVPLALPSRTDGSTDWDALLGAQGPGGPDDFIHRDSSRAIDTTTPEGPVSMRQANADPACASTTPRVVPVCERWTGTPGATVPCGVDNADAYYAVPSRRIVEIARRFDEDPMCNGQPCHNGLVTSICARDYTSAMGQIIAKIRSRLPAPCLPRQLHETTDPTTGNRTVDCLVRETLPVSMQCGDVPDTTPVLDAQGNPETVTDDAGTHALCDLAQVPTDGSGNPGAGDGWYYHPLTNDATCSQRIEFTRGAQPPNDATVRLECIQSVVVPDAGSASTGM